LNGHRHETLRIAAWASYDWANSSFPTVVSTFVIAAYFVQGIAPDPATGQAQWGWMQSAAGLAVAILSPLLGAIADAGGRRRLMLGVFTLLTAIATGLTARHVREVAQVRLLSRRTRAHTGIQ
jgi:UMF1 family MFS transporter